MVLLVKALLGIAGIVGGLFLLRWTNSYLLTVAKFNIVAMTIFAISRLGLFVLIFLVLRIPPHSDVNVYYGEAHEVLHGEIPLVNFASAYGPLFDYISAAIVVCWNSPVALVLLSVGLEFCAFPIWMRVGRKAFTETQTRQAAALYVANPLAISSVVITGQNHVGLSLFLALSLLALMHDRNARSGLWLGLSIVAIKFLSLLFMPILFLASKRRLVWVVGFAAFPLLGYGFIIAFSGNPLRQVIFHAYDSSSGNIPYLLGATGLTLTGPHERLVADIAAFALLCGVFLLAVRRVQKFQPSGTIFMCALVLIVTMVANKKAYASYLIVALFPMCLAVAVQTRLVLAAVYFFILSALAMLEPSLWFRWMHEAQLSVLLDQSVAPAVTRLRVLLFFACDVLLVIGYLGMCAILWRSITEQDSPSIKLQN
jgi:hypothetical protein